MKKMHVLKLCLVLLLGLQNVSHASQPQEDLDKCIVAVSIAAADYARCLSTQLPGALDADEVAEQTSCGPLLGESVLRLREEFVGKMSVDGRECGLDSPSIKGMAALIRQALKYYNRRQGAALSLSETASLSTMSPEISNAERVCATAGGEWVSDTMTCSGLGADGSAYVCENLGGSWSDAGNVCAEVARCQVLGLCGPCGIASASTPDVPCSPSTISDVSCDASASEAAEWRAGVLEYEGLDNYQARACLPVAPFISSELVCAGALLTFSETAALCAILVPSSDFPVVPDAPTSPSLPTGSWPATCDTKSWDGTTLCAVCATATSLIRDSYSCASCPAASYDNLLGILSCTLD